MQPGVKLVGFSIRHPKVVTTAMILATLILGALMVNVRVDTDPENMLSPDEAVRIFHNQTKREFTLYDMVVLGIVNDQDPDGVFNPDTLQRVAQLTDFAATLSWPDPEDPDQRVGVVARDIIAPGNVDHIEQAGAGEVRFEWLMREVPADREGARRLRDRAMSNPMLKGTLVSEDGKALGLYLPITHKDLAHRIQTELRAKIATFNGDDQYYITGLPVAEDTFGVEMFIQMAISAPLAMLAIFLLMLLFFRKLTLIIPPMIIAMASVISTMGLLIGTGHTVHIMSSMIPIFLMPVAVVDSVHILSEFHDRYRQTGDRLLTMEQVMVQLFKPMLYTSLTSAAGFASLALTPIPPVRVFGIFVAFGIMLAWLLTITFVPAFVAMMKEESLANLGSTTTGKGGGDSWLSRRLFWLGNATSRWAKPIIALSLLSLVVAGYGITRIQINDNPVNWFTPNHPIRVADRVLNDHFGGTYEAFLVVEAGDEQEIFKQPAMLRYLEALQNHLLATGIVGKSNSVTDIVKKVHQELYEGRPEQSRVPDSAAAVAQTLISYESSHKPDDLFHFITPDYRKANIWVQLKSGDNKDMEEVVRAVEEFFVSQPPPLPVTHQWAGLTYLNVVWQDKMVSGMLKAFMGSFVVVFIMMTILFRSPLWGIVAMVPLTLTIGLIYGLVGLIGKDYDMPIAVLSSLTLGLAIDFAIHFLERSRAAYKQTGNWPEAAGIMFAEPARAISRNVIVVAVGFMPLLAAPLLPYKTVGFFLAAIMAISGVATMVIIPALITLLEPRMFRGGQRSGG